MNLLDSSSCNVNKTQQTRFDQQALLLQQKKWNVEGSTSTTPYSKSNYEVTDDYNAQILGAVPHNVMAKRKQGKILGNILAGQSQ